MRASSPGWRPWRARSRRARADGRCGRSSRPPDQGQDAFDGLVLGLQVLLDLDGLVEDGVGVLEAFPIIGLGLAFYMLLVVANVPNLLTHLH